MVDILYVDNHLIVAYKNSGILSQSDGSGKEDMLTILKDYIKKEYNKPGNVYLGLVHRLDIFTSGIMVFARTSKAAKRLQEQITSNKFNKRYLALVEGTLTNNEYVTLNNNIYKDEEFKKSFIRNDGKNATLHYKVISNYKVNNIDTSLLEIKLDTGRFHQIRCQLSNINHPLYGDNKYGSKHKIDRDLFPLQAYYLSFYHPVTNELLEFKHINKTELIKYDI